MMEVFSDAVVAWRLPTRGKKAGEKGIALSGFGNRENFHSTTFRQSIGQIITIPFPNFVAQIARPTTRTIFKIFNIFKDCSLRMVFGRA
jgi:hypothetical protein